MRARLNGTLPMNVQFDANQPGVGVFTNVLPKMVSTGLDM